MNKEIAENIKASIGIVMILLTILQIVSLKYFSPQHTVFLGALVILCNTVNINIDAYVKSKNETTDEAENNDEAENIERA